MIDLGSPNRQSTWAVVFLAWRLVRNVGGIQIAVAIFFVATGGLGGRLLLIVPVVGALVAAASVLSWWRFTFCLVDDEFVVRSGVLRVDRLSVPITRVQSVSTQQDLLHRLVGVVRISLDTAGSEETEFRLDAVDKSVAHELQRVVGRTSAATTQPDASDSTVDTPGTPAATLLRHSPGRLVLAAFTSWPWAGLAILAPIFAFRDQFGNAVPLPAIDVERAQWWWIAPAVTAFVGIAVILNVIQILLRNWNLHVEADDSSIRRSAGLISRRQDARDASKVQVVSTSSNPLQCWCGLTALTFSVIGDGSLEMIGCDADEVTGLSSAVGVTPIGMVRPARRIERAEIWLATRNTAVVTVPIVVAATFVVSWWPLIGLVAIPIAWFRRHLHVRSFRWDVTDSELVSTGRIIDKWTKQSLLRTTNGVKVTRSLFERRRDLASVDVATAAGTITIGMLRVDEAEALRDLVLARVLLDDEPWM